MYLDKFGALGNISLIVSVEKFLYTSLHLAWVDFFDPIGHSHSLLAKMSRVAIQSLC